MVSKFRYKQKMFFKLGEETLKGKGLGRSLVNFKLLEKNILLSGKILDLGGRELYWVKGQPRGGSYMRFLKFGKVKILRLDIDDEIRPDYEIDFEKDVLPFEDNSIDNVLAFNLFEHIYNYKFLAKEIFRVLKLGGQVLGSVPFLVRIHPDPEDFFRYSNQALERIFKESGFKKIEIECVGAGPFINGYSQIEFIFPRICRFFLSYVSIFLDKIFLKLKPSLRERFPLSYIFILRK